MKSRSITDPQDSSDGFPNTAWDEFYTNFFPSSFSNSRGNPLASGPAPVEIPVTPALTSEAVASLGAQSGPTTVTVLTTGGITINLLFDAAAMAAPASFRAGIQQAASILTAAISDKITVDIKIDYSGTGGGAAAGPDAGSYQSYTSIRADLVNNATQGDITFNALPTGSSIQGQSSVAVWNAQLKLWGLLGANDTTTDDGSATFATDIGPNLLVGVALHELTHAMGRVPYGSAPDIFDLFRFTSAGTRLFSGSATAPAAYFSVDGGNTKLADYGTISDSSDFLNSGVQGSSDPFNEFYGGGTLQSLTAVDIAQLDALGFHTAPQSGFVVAATASQAIQGGPAVTLLSGPPTVTDPASTTLSSATIKIANTGGSAVTGDELYINGQQSGTVDGGLVTVNWNDVTKTLNLAGNVSIAAYQTLLSQITYQDAGTDSSAGSHPLRTTTWNVNDGTANIVATSQIGIERAPIVTAANVTLSSVTVAASSLFTTSDPDGDAITTYAFKDTVNGHFVLNGVAQANNQEIDVTAAQLAQLTYQNAVGTDSLQIRVSDGTQWGAWQSFAVTGPVPIAIESFGSTSLVEIGSSFCINGDSGPVLKISGAAVVAGQSGGWTPIGAEQTATGYEVAWKLAGVDQYSVWNTDSTGNYVSNAIGVASGTSAAIESIETSFHQDLNGDGTIGPISIVIESFGSTSLVEIGSNFYLNGGSGPVLKISGAAVVAGQSGGWTPIGAEQTATGYEVAWKLAGADQYSVWNTDSTGNYISNAIGVASGTSAAVESIETSFHQDLNGDGTIGIPLSHTGPMLELAGASSDSVTFSGTPSILTLDTPSSFAGEIKGFTGDGTLAGSDQIDLRGMNYSTVHSSYDSSTGVLEISDGTTTADLKFTGTYSQANFKFADDGNGGTIVYDPPTSGQQASPAGATNDPGGQVASVNSVGLSVTAGYDSFVFEPNLGRVTIANFNPAKDTIQIDHTVFATIAALIAHTADNASGNAVIAADAHNTITITGVTTDALQHHLNDFIIV